MRKNMIASLTHTHTRASVNPIMRFDDSLAWYVCMYVCMYVYMYICMYVCIHVYNVCMYVCTCRLCTNSKCAKAFSGVYVRMCMCIYVCMYVCMCVCVYVCMYMCM